MQYFEYYDIQREAYPYVGYLVAGPTILAFGILFLFTFKNIPHPSGRALSKAEKYCFPVGMILLGIVWISISLFSYFGYVELRNAARDGKVEVVEGKVEHFVPMPYEGHAEETFDVKGQRFAYSDYIIGGGFNRTSSHGGPICEGLQVRITHTDGTILKLEIAMGP